MRAACAFSRAPYRRTAPRGLCGEPRRSIDVETEIDLTAKQIRQSPVRSPSSAAPSSPRTWHSRPTCHPRDVRLSQTHRLDLEQLGVMAGLTAPARAFEHLGLAHGGREAE